MTDERQRDPRDDLDEVAPTDLPVTGGDRRTAEGVEDRPGPDGDEEKNPLLREGPDAPDAADIADPDEQM